MVKVKPTVNQGRITVKTSNDTTVFGVKDNLSEYYAKLAERWANSPDMVNGIDYSSKYYAEQSKTSAQVAYDAKTVAQELINGFDNNIQIAKDDIEQNKINSINAINNTCSVALGDMYEKSDEVLTNLEATKAEAENSINNTKTTTISDIEFIAEGEKQEILGLVDDEKEEIKDLANLIKENARDIASRTSFAMFDTVLKDHILTYEESKGLALQGTYVYKEAVAGSRYGYADFYNKCLQEFENSEYEKIKFEQPVLSANGTLGGDSFAVSASVEHDSGKNIYYAYRCFASNANTSETTSWLALATTASYTIYNPIALNITNIQITNRMSYPRAVGSGRVLGSNDNDTWEEITSFTNTDNNTSVVWNINLSNNKKSYKYYKLDNLTGIDGEWISIGKINITATYNSVFKANANGHIFYDIADKNQIDELFNQTGMAWFYGIDQENERVFLPRNKYVAIKGSADSVTVDVYGNGKTLGLTNGEQNIGLITYSAGVIGGMTGCYNKNYGTGTGGDWNRNQKAFGVVKDATKSGLTGKADTSQVVQIDDTKYLYICVGNTVSQSAITDVVDVTTTENDTTPLFTGMYFDFTPNNVSWLKAGEQANSGGIYKFTYNELVNILNGETKYGDLKVINVADMEVGVDYSEYWKVNQEEMTFTTPSVAGLFPNNRILVAKKEPTEDDTTWYNLYSDGWLEQGGYVDNYTAIKTIQLSKAYIDTNYSIFATSRYSTTDATLYQPHVDSLTTTSFKCASYGERGSNTNSGGSPVFWQTSGYAEIPTVSDYTENVNLYFKVANAVQNLELLDAGEVMEAVAEIASNAVLKTENKAYIVETYVNGTSWYRVYSDGWCEQGGRGALNEVATTTITLLKPYKDTNYSVSAVSITASTASDTEVGLQCTPKSTTQITLTAHYLNPNNQTACWEAKGYIA